MGEELVNHLSRLPMQQRDFGPDFLTILHTPLHQGLNIEVAFRDLHLDKEFPAHAFEHPGFPHEKVFSLGFFPLPKRDPKALVFAVSFIKHPSALCGVFLHLAEGDKFVTAAFKSRAHNQPEVALVLVLLVLVVGHNLEE